MDSSLCFLPAKIGFNSPDIYLSSDGNTLYVFPSESFVIIYPFDGVSYILESKSSTLIILKESLLSEEILKQLKEYINTYLNSESESSITQGEASLEGAVYGIYAAKDIVHQDNKTGVLFKKNELVKTAVIGKSPKRNADGYLLNTDGSRNIENLNGVAAYEETPGKTAFAEVVIG